MNRAAQGNRLQLRIAGLHLILDAQASGLELGLPAPHDQFAINKTENQEDLTLAERQLQLKIVDSPIPPGLRLVDPVIMEKIFEVEEQPSGAVVFYAPRQTPPRAIRVDPQFTTGEVYGEFSASLSQPFYPLQYIDIILFSNWLASYGEVILHAAGVALHGEGVVFAGQSGVGKSTLTGLLMDTPGLTVLGEDQVILRQVEGQFWIFGTPWHVNPDRCSPIGAPLKRIYLLNKTGAEAVARLTPAEGMWRLIQSTFIPLYRKNLIGGILETLSRLCEQVPGHELSYLLDSDIIDLIQV